MILSFHPIFEGDKNILCAGRDPGKDDLAAIKAADAVILPQGCRQTLYDMARENCPHVFPNYDAEFKYPGKIGQAHLFQKTNVPHPKTETYLTVDDFTQVSSFKFQVSSFKFQVSSFKFQVSSFPFVFKFDWGGEGDNVFLIKSHGEFQEVLQKAILFEKTGQKGFLIQEYIPSKNRTLRVVIMGEKIISYWRVQEGAECFCANLAHGAVIDAESDPDLQAEAVRSVRHFCKKTGINLAGFDFLFSHDSESGTDVNIPLFLEINYFFGRRGLGGSEKFYELLITEIKKWTENL
ncbi:ATP-grasp domain-containing protein [Desulfonema magnum]|uniref:RimK-like ATP-grasp domain-containing protein n=1 Tax=Desulfonema magnum TaxID=45655 RepID=A0A975GNU5_9BACT|nr:hypothetical protein [Desulfonema magnum]QTA88137.1 RimK-like ATP-grasp domain-containing protein [Desulfonema magnum]